MHNCKDTEGWCATPMMQQIETPTPEHKALIQSNQDLRISHKLHWGTELIVQKSTSKRVKSAF